MNYDEWKTQVSDDQDEFLYECSECGKLVEKKHTYCSDDCFKASQL